MALEVLTRSAPCLDLPAGAALRIGRDALGAVLERFAAYE